MVGVTWYITSKRKSQAQQRASAAGAVPATLAGIENITKWPRGNYGGGAPPPANKGMAGDFGGGGPHAGGNVVELVVAKGIAPEKTRMALEQVRRLDQRCVAA